MRHYDFRVGLLHPKRKENKIHNLPKKKKRSTRKETLSFEPNTHTYASYFEYFYYTHAYTNENLPQTDTDCKCRFYILLACIFVFLLSNTCSLNGTKQQQHHIQPPVFVFFLFYCIYSLYVCFGFTSARV